MLQEEVDGEDKSCSWEKQGRREKGDERSKNRKSLDILLPDGKDGAVHNNREGGKVKVKEVKGGNPRASGRFLAFLGRSQLVAVGVYSAKIDNVD